MGIKDRVKQIRRGLTQKAFAKKIGVSLTAVQYWESGKIPSGEPLKIIREKLGVDINWLLTGEGEPFIKDNAVCADNSLNSKYEDVIKKFEDKDFSLEINQALVDLEKTSLKEFYKLGGYIKALTENGIEMRTEPGRSQTQQNYSDVWDGTERRSGKDRRKSVSEKLRPARKNSSLTG